MTSWRTLTRAQYDKLDLTRPLTLGDRPARNRQHAHGAPAATRTTQLERLAIEGVEIHPNRKHAQHD